MIIEELITEGRPIPAGPHSEVDVFEDARVTVTVWLSMPLDYSRLRSLTTRELAAALLRDDFTLKTQRGSHRLLDCAEQLSTLRRS